MPRNRPVISLFVLIAFLFAAGCWKERDEGEDLEIVELDDLTREIDRSKIKPGGVLKYWLKQDPPNLDPAHARDTTSAVVVMHLFDGLVELDPITLEPLPAVAESWTISDDGRVYTFTIRKGVKFHNGRKVTAEDFRYSFDRILDPDTRSERTWVLEDIKGARARINRKAGNVEGIKVIDDYTLELTLEKPLAFFIFLLSMEAASVLPREEVERWGEDFGQHPMGCGPFTFVSWYNDQKVIVSKFDGYYGEGPYLDEIRFLIIRDKVMAYENYKEGNIDILTDLPPMTVKSAKARYPDDLLVWRILGTNYLSFNHEKWPFKGNKTLRQAFNYAVDRKAICEVLREGVPYPAAGILPKGIQAYDPDLEGYHYDPEKAKELLAKAGYPGGKGLGTIELWYNTDEGHEKDLIEVQGNLREIGVDVTLTNMDWGTYLDATKEGEAAFFRSGWVADLPDPDNFLYILLDSKNIGQGNYSRYDNPEFNSLVEKARELTNMEERIPLYQKAERIAVEDAVWLFLWHYGDYLLRKPYLKGVVTPRQGDWRIPLEKVWIDKGDD